MTANGSHMRVDAEGPPRQIQRPLPHFPVHLSSRTPLPTDIKQEWILGQQQFRLSGKLYRLNYANFIMSIDLYSWLLFCFYLLGKNSFFYPSLIGRFGGKTPGKKINDQFISRIIHCMSKLLMKILFARKKCVCVCRLHRYTLPEIVFPPYIGWN